MRICIYIDSKGMGGIETHILQLISGLLESTDYKIDLLFWQDYSQKMDSRHPLIDKLKRIESSTDKRCRYLSAKGSLAILHEYFLGTISLVHTHGYKAGITARLIGLITGTPIVSTYHNGDPGVGKLKLYNFIDKLTSFLSFNIAVNQIISRPLKKCKVISNFVNSVDKSKLHKELETRKSIAFVGRLSYEKGPDIFAEITKFTHHPVTVFGDGPMMESLESKYSHIKFKGMCDMDEYWQDIRAVIMPSRYEGLPLAALEAMARGIPVIASKAGALPELINHCKVGRSIELNNLSLFRDEINQVMSQENSDYAVQGERLIDFINENFSRKKTLPKIIAQYQQAIN
jgi:glycosyltransferase involved in cell wall biosynthesis